MKQFLNMSMGCKFDAFKYKSYYTPWCFFSYPRFLRKSRTYWALTIFVLRCIMLKNNSRQPFLSIFGNDQSIYNLSLAKVVVNLKEIS